MRRRCAFHVPLDRWLSTCQRQYAGNYIRLSRREIQYSLFKLDASIKIKLAVYATFDVVPSGRDGAERGGL